MAKRALLVGLNAYPDPINALRGCLNDVAQVRSLAESRLGFPAAGIATLTDAAATTRNIVGRLRWLVAGAAPGDVLLFHYSGHGSQVEDRHGDELDDNLDEIICPYDLDWNAPFTDDDLYGLVKDLPGGVNLTVVLDCCHSGTGLREAAPTRPRFMDPPHLSGPDRLQNPRAPPLRCASGAARRDPHGGVPRRPGRGRRVHRRRLPRRVHVLPLPGDRRLCSVGVLQFGHPPCAPPARRQRVRPGARSSKARRTC